MVGNFSSIQDLLNHDLDSLEFYDILPTDDFEVDENSVRAVSWEPLYSSLSSGDILSWPLEDLENLSLFLMSPRAASAPPEQMATLAQHFSLEYIRALKTNTVDKARKMLTQRLNFFLRSLLDKDKISPEESSCKKLPYKCPWDLARRGNEAFYIVSEKNNLVHLKGDQQVRSLRLGLPSQIDDVDGRTLSIGSQFTNGAYLLKEDEAQYLDHDKPVPLVFSHKGGLWLLDIEGNLHSKNTGETRSLSLPNVSKARKFDSLLIIMDWTCPFKFHIYDLDTESLTPVSLKEVFLPNDILIHQNHYFIIDKQQGYLFRYNSKLEYKGRLLGFGRGSGKLFDPIAIRLSQNNRFFEIINWVPSSVSCVPVNSFTSSA